MRELWLLTVHRKSDGRPCALTFEGTLAQYTEIVGVEEPILFATKISVEEAERLEKTFG